MALSRAKYKRIHDLYTPGTELVLKDGTVMWLQVLNPFERDEAQRDAQLARSRLVLALKGPHSEEERGRVEAQFLEQGPRKAIDVLATTMANNKLSDIMDGIRDDPDWKERIELIERGDSTAATPLEPAEQAMLSDYNAQYLTEVNDRINQEREYNLDRLKILSDGELLEEYVDVYITTRGGNVASAEYALTEAWYAARVCEGELQDDGTYDHSKCEGHRLQVYETKQELRAEAEELQDAIGEAMRALAMTVRDARFSARQGSSSGSSPLPNEGEASTASTPTATPA